MSFAPIKWPVKQNLRPNKYQFEYSTCEWNAVVKLKTFWVNCTFLLFILVRFLCLFLRLICKLINKQTKEISARILTFDEEPQQTLNARKMGYPFRSSILLEYTMLKVQFLSKKSHSTLRATNVHEKFLKTWSHFLKGQKLLKNAKNWESKRDILIFVWFFLDTLLTFGALCFLEVLEDMKKCKFFPHPQNEWTMEIVN